ncbi:hypothetical protein NDU88_004324 [Pleurodeles waltl]|uniref:Secreted protein n=1 Tax=Pleurodeles waltl TaxID=8319 RepID=A0AAV7PDN3_PLEWA|nr:hypothetical protein NDU88_004324 [Pleurodeles waltl]
MQLRWLLWMELLWCLVACVQVKLHIRPAGEGSTGVPRGGLDAGRGAARVESEEIFSSVTASGGVGSAWTRGTVDGRSPCVDGGGRACFWRASGAAVIKKGRWEGGAAGRREAGNGGQMGARGERGCRGRSDGSGESAKAEKEKIRRERQK